MPSSPFRGALLLVAARRSNSLRLLFNNGLRTLDLLLLRLVIVIASLPKLVDSPVVNSVHPALVQSNEVDDVVTERSKTMECWHLDCEGEEVVNKTTLS